MELRQFQQDMVNDAAAAMRAGAKRVLIQLGTGGGKTVIASEILKRLVAKMKRALFLAHRRELITQAETKLRTFGLHPGILMAGHRALPHRQVQVGSIQTLDARVLKREKALAAASDEEAQQMQAALDVGGFHLIVIDEAHRTLGATYLAALERWPDAYVIGLTATPARKDGRGLGHVYDHMVQGPTVQEMIDLGFLVPVRYFCAERAPDLSDVKIVAGDYKQDQLEKAVNKAALVADIVESWSKHGKGRQTVVFASGVAHSMALKERFSAAGIAAAHLDGKTPKNERDHILWQLSEGHIQVVCNCDVLTEGWDQPLVSCIVIAKPTKSIVKYLQMAGRALRPMPGKDCCVLLDHASVVNEHGFVESDRDWSLKTTGKKEPNGKLKRKEPKPHTCPQCFAMFSKTRTCPNCGYLIVLQGKDIAEDAGEMKEMKAGKKEPSKEEHRLFFCQLLDYARTHGKKPGWALYKTREKFKLPEGNYPPVQWLRFDPVSCGPEVSAWVRSRNIAYAKKLTKELKAG